MQIEIHKKDVTPAQSIPIMTNFVIEPAMEHHVEYGTSELQSYRTVAHDAIKLYGFRFKNAETGKIKVSLRIEEGLRKRVTKRF